MHEERHNHSHHHHDHEVGHDGEKLLKRIIHWKRHNEDHLESYREWAKKAESMGYGEVKELLNEICYKAEEQNGLFDRIIKIIESKL
ncbi:MAG: hypothetical protein N2260_02280 [Syntrophobacterales bacterium]|nr:hypothetical protein [Syntrophobacterales bacterium]